MISFDSLNRFDRFAECALIVLFLIKWAKPGLFLFHFVLFSHCKDKYSINLTINEKSVEGVLGSRTRGGRMEGADESIEIWWDPKPRQF